MTIESFFYPKKKKLSALSYLKQPSSTTIKPVVLLLAFHSWILLSVTRASVALLRITPIPPGSELFMGPISFIDADVESTYEATRTPKQVFDMVLLGLDVRRLNTEADAMVKGVDIGRHCARLLEVVIAPCYDPELPGVLAISLSVVTALMQPAGSTPYALLSFSVLEDTLTSCLSITAMSWAKLWTFMPCTVTPLTSPGLLCLSCVRPRCHLASRQRWPRRCTPETVLLGSANPVQRLVAGASSLNTAPLATRCIPSLTMGSSS